MIIVKMYLNQIVPTKRSNWDLYPEVIMYSIEKSSVPNGE